jgi:hypothetical protein
MADDQYLLPEFKPAWFKRVSVDRILSIGAIVIALASATSTLLQYRAADRQATTAERALELAKNAAAEQAKDVERSRIAAERGAAAAEGSNDSARISAELSRKQLLNSISLFRIDQRARVDVIGFQRTSDFVVDKPVKFRIQFKNVGKTPGIQFSTETWINVGPKFSPQYIETQGEKPSVSDIGAGTTKLADISVTLGKAWFDQVYLNRARIYVYGYVRYKDIFDAQHLRETLFCAIYPGDVGGIESRDLDICSTHNTTN